jgi:hypothetical protein
MPRSPSSSRSPSLVTSPLGGSRTTHSRGEMIYKCCYNCSNYLLKF